MGAKISVCCVLYYCVAFELELYVLITYLPFSTHLHTHNLSVPSQIWISTFASQVCPNGFIIATNFPGKKCYVINSTRAATLRDGCAGFADPPLIPAQLHTDHTNLSSGSQQTKRSAL